MSACFPSVVKHLGLRRGARRGDGGRLGGQTDENENLPDGLSFGNEGDDFAFAVTFCAHQQVVGEQLGRASISMELPGPLADLGQAQAGWSSDLRLGAGVAADYYFGTDPRGPRDWFAGLHVAWTTFRVAHDDIPGESVDYSTLLFGARIAYQWHPLAGDFYVTPWLGLGLPIKITGSTTVGAGAARTQTYRLPPVIPLFAVHLGWSF